MDKRYGYFFVAGLAIGALFGSVYGAANGNGLAGIGGGAVLGVFVGWFAAAAAMQIDRLK